MIIAHRGFSGHYPENTLRAFQEALKLKVDAVELDVRRTQDSALVVIHDETVDRTTNGSGYVSELTWDEIKSLDAGIKKDKNFAGEHIPTLDDTLELVNGQTMLIVEIKEPDTVAQIVDSIKRHNAHDWVNLVSFHAEAIASAKELAPQISRTLIGGADIGLSDKAFRDFVHTAFSNSANSITVHYSTLTESRVRYCHERFLTVGTWTVDKGDLANKLVSIGVDWIATNYPDVMVGLVEGRRAA